MLLLSAEARQQYERLDGNEQDYWERHIFPKLLDPELCDRQSESIEGPNGTCWVYPRSGTAAGRRVIYYRDDEDVYVCELFASHKDYDKDYDRFRTAYRGTGIDRERYGSFREQALPASCLREDVSDYGILQGVPTQTYPHG